MLPLYSFRLRTDLHLLLTVASEITPAPLSPLSPLSPMSCGISWLSSVQFERFQSEKSNGEVLRHRRCCSKENNGIPCKFYTSVYCGLSYLCIWLVLAFHLGLTIPFDHEVQDQMKAIEEQKQKVIEELKAEGRWDYKKDEEISVDAQPISKKKSPPEDNNGACSLSLRFARLKA